MESDMFKLEKFKDYDKMNVLFFRDHDKIIKKYNINFISLKSVKIPLVVLYNINHTLFNNEKIYLKISDIIVLTLFSIGLLSKENKESLKRLYDLCVRRKIEKYIPLVKNTIKSIKNLLNIIIKKENIVILNIEQGLKFKYTTNILNFIITFIKFNNIAVKDFSIWYISNQRTLLSKKLIDYINYNI